MTSLPRRARESINVANGVSDDQLRGVMGAALNPLSGETLYPELAAVSDPTGRAAGEITVSKNIVGSKLDVTYDPNADVRLGALDAAVKLIKGTKTKVPDLEVYFPRAGRTVEVQQVMATRKVIRLAGGSSSCRPASQRQMGITRRCATLFAKCHRSQRSP
jgi:hypothetical protein